jgi:hypothetical protein
MTVISKVFSNISPTSMVDMWNCWGKLCHKMFPVQQKIYWYLATQTSLTPLPFICLVHQHASQFLLITILSTFIATNLEQSSSMSLLPSELHSPTLLSFKTYLKTTIISKSVNTWLVEGLAKMTDATYLYSVISYRITVVIDKCTKTVKFEVSQQ